MKIVAFMRDLVAKGMSWEDAAEFAERFELGVTEALEKVRARSSGAERQARYRERRKTGDVTRDVTSDASPEHNETLSLPSAPQTPHQPTHTPPEITTRPRGDAGFARFWLAYPRKTAKGDARKAYDRAVRKLMAADINRDPEMVLIGALERAKAAWTDAQYIPHPATWLNGERWDDEPETAAPRKAYAERPHHDAKFDARQANLARAFAGADSAARQRREP